MSGGGMLGAIVGVSFAFLLALPEPSGMLAGITDGQFIALAILLIAVGTLVGGYIGFQGELRDWQAIDDAFGKPKREWRARVKANHAATLRRVRGE